MDRRLGASFAFLAFTVAVVGGLAVGNPVAVILRRAILALFLFYVLGTVLAWISERILAERQDQLSAKLDDQVAASAASIAEQTESPPTGVAGTPVAKAQGSESSPGETPGEQ